MRALAAGTTTIDKARSEVGQASITEVHSVLFLSVLGLARR